MTPPLLSPRSEAERDAYCASRPQPDRLQIVKPDSDEADIPF